MSTRARSDLLAGRTAVVTGASRGIGEAVARRLGECGARVALVARGAERLTSLAADIGGDAIAMPCDLGDGDALMRTLERVGAELGGAPDIVVNNAGAFMIAPVAETSVDAFAELLAVNLSAPFAAMRALLPAMRARGSGHVLSIGSIADRVTFPGNGAYAASKYGLRALHEVLRAELRGTAVRSTLVSPGPVDTELWDAIDPDNQPGFTPRASMLSPAHVADAVMYALSAPAELNVDELRLSRS